MGLLDGLLGNASEIEVSKIEGDFAQVLSSGMRVEKAYQLIRDIRSRSIRNLLALT